MGILDALKLGAGVALGILLTSVYWLGIPLLNDYPILKGIPLIGPLGAVDTYLSHRIVAAKASMAL